MLKLAPLASWHARRTPSFDSLLVAPSRACPGLSNCQRCPDTKCVSDVLIPNLAANPKPQAPAHYPCPETDADAEHAYEHDTDADLHGALVHRDKHGALNAIRFIDTHDADRLSADDNNGA